MRMFAEQTSIDPNLLWTLGGGGNTTSKKLSWYFHVLVTLLIVLNKCKAVKSQE